MPGWRPAAHGTLICLRGRPSCSCWCILRTGVLPPQINVLLRLLLPAGSTGGPFQAARAGQVHHRIDSGGGHEGVVWRGGWCWPTGPAGKLVTSAAGKLLGTSMCVAQLRSPDLLALLLAQAGGMQHFERPTCWPALALPACHLLMHVISPPPLCRRWRRTTS